MSPVLRQRVRIWGASQTIGSDRINMLRRPFKFPTKLWLLLGLGIFLYLYFRIPIEDKTIPRPTLLKDLPESQFLFLVLGSVLYFLTAFCSGFFIAAIFGIFRALFQRSCGSQRVAEFGADSAD